MSDDERSQSSLSHNHELVTIKVVDGDDQQLLSPNFSLSSDPPPRSEEVRNSQTFTFASISMTVLYLAVPLAISRMSWTVIKTTDTALIGHTGTRFLSATAVADLYIQSTGVFIDGGILSTFVSQAYGSTNKKMGGVWFQVSLVVVGSLAIPVLVSYMVCGPVLSVMGVDQELIRPAAYYAFVMCLAIPSRIGIGQISQFLLAQGVTAPLVQTGLFSMTLNLILGLVLVFGIGIPGFNGFGFWICPLVSVCVEWATLLVYVWWFCLRKRLHERGGCWPDDGFSCVYITAQRVKEYLRLYIPASLAIASDWWRVSAIGAVAVSFHDEASLAVFNSAYRVTWMSLIVIGSVGSAMSILIGQQLGSGDYRNAQRIAHMCLLLALGLVLLLASVFYSVPGKVALIFSSDEKVVDLYQAVALPLTTMLIAMNMSVLLERVPMSCGRTRVVMWTSLIGSWLCQVPAVLLCTQFYRNDLFGLFVGVTIGYCAVDIMLLRVIFTTNWHFYAMEASRRSEAAVQTPED